LGIAAIVVNFYLFTCLFICLWTDTKSTVWTHTLCRTQVDKNRQNRTFYKALEPVESQTFCKRV